MALAQVDVSRGRSSHFSIRRSTEWREKERERERDEAFGSFRGLSNDQESFVSPANELILTRIAQWNMKFVLCMPEKNVEHSSHNYMKCLRLIFFGTILHMQSRTYEFFFLRSMQIFLRIMKSRGIWNNKRGLINFSNPFGLYKSNVSYVLY